MKHPILLPLVLLLATSAQAQFNFRRAGYTETYANPNTYSTFNSSADTKSDPVACNPLTGTTVFIHQDTVLASPRGFGLRLDWSPDGKSNNWKRNIGLLNPNRSKKTFNPQALVFNPANTSNPDDDRVFWLANTMNGGGLIDGVVMGVCNPRATPFSGTESYHLFDSLDVHIHSIAMAENGVFYAVGNDNQSPNWVIVYKIVYDAGANSLSFRWHARLNTRDISYLQGSFIRPRQQPVIAFDPSGQTGWIGLTGDTAINGGIFHPILFRSGDAGASWTGPYYPDIRFLNWPTSWVDDNDRLINRRRTLYDEYDLVVDKFGVPHFIAGVWQAADNDIQQNGYRVDAPLNGRIIDFSSADNGSNWSTQEIAPIIQKEYSYTSPSMKSGLLLSNHLKASMDVSGMYYFISWVDMDTSARWYEPKNYSNNSHPDLFISGVDLNMRQRACIKKATHQHITYDSKSFSPYLAAHCLREARGNGYNYRMPLVLPVEPDDYVLPSQSGIEHLIMGDTAWYRDYEFEPFSSLPDYEAACAAEPMQVAAQRMNPVRVYPNPAGADGFVMEAGPNAAIAELFDAAGRAMGRWQIQPGKALRVGAESYRSGIYHLRFRLADGDLFHTPLIIP